MSTGAAFNPMRRTPPPPPHMDSVGINPSDYVSVLSNDKGEFIVHLESLRASPLLRRTLSKGCSIYLDHLHVEFDSAPPESSSGPVPVPSPSPYSYEDQRLHNTSLRVIFPSLNSTMTQAVLQYLYHKQQFEHFPGKGAPTLNIGVSSAIPILKVAHTLEC